MATVRARAGGDYGERGAALAGPEGSTHALRLQPVLLPRTAARSWLQGVAALGNSRELRDLKRRVAAARGVEDSLASAAGHGFRMDLQ